MEPFVQFVGNNDYDGCITCADQEARTARKSLAFNLFDQMLNLASSDALGSTSLCPIVPTGVSGSNKLSRLGGFSVVCLLRQGDYFYEILRKIDN